MKGQWIEQEVAAQVDGGCDHGATGKVLVRFGEVRLIWRKGSLYWNGIGMPYSYAPASLEVIGSEEHKNFSGMSKEVEPCGGRLTLKRIREALPEIRKLMKLPGLDIRHFDLKRTYVVS